MGHYEHPKISYREGEEEKSGPKGSGQKSRHGIIHLSGALAPTSLIVAIVKKPSELCRQCQCHGVERVVICYRATPRQKGEVTVALRPFDEPRRQICVGRIEAIKSLRHDGVECPEVGHIPAVHHIVAAAYHPPERVVKQGESILVSA